jgi:predicted RNA binding protein YcfA (HicA-like mRNA interferase family)
MPRIPGIGQKDAVRAFGKMGFTIRRQSKHIVMSKGPVYLVIPRHTEIKATTMGHIAKTAGLTPEQFRALL